MTAVPDSPAPTADDPQGSCPLPGSPEWNLRTYLVPFVLGIFVTLFLWLVSLYNFALYHTTVEITTIAISVAIFLLIWNSRKIIDNNYLLFIGVTFVFIAILDFLHTLVYQGVGIFADGGGTLSTRFWIAARYMQAVTLLAAPLFIRRKLRLDLVAIVYLASDAIIVASIFFFKIFPATYIAGSGLTPFKIISEYIIVVLLVAAVWLLWRNRESFDREVLNNLVIAIFLTIAAELTFTEYASFTDIFSLLGHVFRLVAYYFFYRAIVEVGQKKPYALLYRNLNESEKKYRALIDLSPDAVVVLRDRKIQFANLAGLRLAGVADLNELAGKDFTGFIIPDDRAASEKRIDAVQNSRITAPVKEVRLTDGDRIVPAEVTSGPVEWDGLPAVQVVIRDITERKRSDQAIAELNRDQKIILDNMPAMIWYKDTRNNFIRVNEAVAKNTGLPVDAFEGKNASDLFPDEGELYYQDDLRVISSGIPRFGIVEQLAVTGGKKIWVQTDKIPLRDGKGTITGVLVFSLDITARKHAEEELTRKNADLNALNEELTAAHEELQANLDVIFRREQELSENEVRLKEALAEKEVLLSEIHHRVKNNLTAFISLLSLEGSYEESPAGQALKKDLQNRARSMSLIHETLYRTKKYSAVDMGVYLTTLVDQVSASYATKKSVRISVKAEDISLDLHRATPVGLIINELVTNSFKYAFPESFNVMEARGSPPAITITLTKTDGLYELTFRDNGIGLPPGFDIATTQSLGLKLVNFLARHQMRSKVEVNTATGTEFVFRFKE